VEPDSTTRCAAGWCRATAPPPCTRAPCWYIDNTVCEHSGKWRAALPNRSTATTSWSSSPSPSKWRLPWNAGGWLHCPQSMALERASSGVFHPGQAQHAPPVAG
jgi:hypothetical protein